MTTAACTVRASTLRHAPSGPLDLVGAGDVGVHVRVTGSGVPVVECRGDHAARPGLIATGLTRARADHVLLDELQ